MVKIIAIILSTALSIVYSCYRLRREIHIFQLNSYKVNRYFKWLKRNYIFSITFLLDIIFFTSIWFFDSYKYYFIFSIVFIFKIVLLYNIKEKKPLKFTDRVKRLIAILALFSIILFFGFIYTEYGVFRSIFLTGSTISLLSFSFLIFASIIISPIENQINNYYINDAKRILKEFSDLKIIAITGSYGKTSTKNYLYNILSTQYRVLMTPGSYNTTMGVVRTVRENLKPYHQIFIVEMGAKQIGDIKEICEIVEHDIAILTSIGEQHLDTFKHINNIIKTKFEIVESLNQYGIAILNFNNKYIASHKYRNIIKNQFDHSGINSKWKTKKTSLSSRGIEFEVLCDDNLKYKLRTRILGDHNIENILASIITASILGISDRNIFYGVSTLNPVKHRLEVFNRNGITIIDDSFNSNPIGALNALKVLDMMEGGKKIIVTPGMVELGNKQFDYNKELGERIADFADIAVIVGHTNKEAIISGLISKSYDRDNVYTINELSEISSLLEKIAKAEDVVLYENDLPDTYE